MSVSFRESKMHEGTAVPEFIKNRKICQLRNKTTLQYLDVAVSIKVNSQAMQ